MISKYIEVSATWVNENIEQYPSINSAQHNNGKWFTSANARVEFPSLFNGNEVVYEFDNKDFLNTNNEL